MRWNFATAAAIATAWCVCVNREINIIAGAHVFIAHFYEAGEFWDLWPYLN